MLLIKNCKILENNLLADKSILIGDNGLIQEIASPSSVKSADEIINAAGLIAIPGMIDAHVHCREPGNGKVENFLTASRAAAKGGVTTIIDMPNTKPATTTVALLDEKRKLAAGKCIVNFGFHFGANGKNADEIRKAANIAAVKVYMGSSTGELLVTDEKALQEIFNSGKRIAVHAENDEMIKANEAKLKGSSNSAMQLHLKIRDNSVAASETERAIALARKFKAKLHICHLSTHEEIMMVQENKHLMPLSCEVTPHHLFLSVEDNKSLSNYGKVNPPVRAKQDVAALWEAINDGTIDIIASDHAPHDSADKEEDYWNAPSGVPGLETTLPLLLDAVNKDRISLQQLIRLSSSNPASIFGIKNKGAIEKGFDADIALVDLSQEHVLKEFETGCGWSPFQNWKLKGSVEKTIVSGKIIYEGDGSINDSVKGKEAAFR